MKDGKRNSLRRILPCLELGCVTHSIILRFNSLNFDEIAHSNLFVILGNIGFDQNLYETR
jgi:hypothetical protein